MLWNIKYITNIFFTQRPSLFTRWSLIAGFRHQNTPIFKNNCAIQLISQKGAQMKDPTFDLAPKDPFVGEACHPKTPWSFFHFSNYHLHPHNDTKTSGKCKSTNTPQKSQTKMRNKRTLLRSVLVLLSCLDILFGDKYSIHNLISMNKHVTKAWPIRVIIACTISHAMSAYTSARNNASRFVSKTVTFSKQFNNVAGQNS